MSNASADEEDFLELVVANETVCTWLDKWKSYAKDQNVDRLAVLLHDIAKTISTKEPYAEEARECGMADEALRTMKSFSHVLSDTLLDDLSVIIATCSGPLAQGDRVRSIEYGGHTIYIKEGALGDGVGAKVWRVARIMCQKMVDDPALCVEGKDVLEVGAGCGACGFLAGKMGAHQVVVSDYVDQLLLNLKEALHRNEFPGQQVGDRDQEWNNGNVAVRFIDWEDSVALLEQQTPVDIKSPAALDGESSRIVAPGVPEESKFDIILGTDVLYEWPMVQSLSATLQHRLRPDGTAYICNAVRDQAMFDAFIDSMRSRHLDVSVSHLDTETTHEQESFCREQEYEGGYNTLTDIVYDSIE
ncbi:hypothetical protein M9434_004825 [Picochlorum sp. BPE23]|nr:hypothetical protein M9434_004825 [Picochlorum sp. BPE23]